MNQHYDEVAVKRHDSALIQPNLTEGGRGDGRSILTSHYRLCKTRELFGSLLLQNYFACLLACLLAQSRYLSPYTDTLQDVAKSNTEPCTPILKKSTNTRTFAHTFNRLVISERLGLVYRLDVLFSPSNLLLIVGLSIFASLFWLVIITLANGFSL